MPTDDSLVGVVIIGAAIAALFFYSRDAKARSITTADDQADKPAFNPSVVVTFPNDTTVQDANDINAVDNTSGAVWYDDNGNIVYSTESNMTDNLFTAPFYAADFPTDLSQEGLQAIMTREGYSDVPYPDAGGYSIGYGHFIKPGEDLKHVTPAQAADLIIADTNAAVADVVRALQVPITQNAFDALVSFRYNVGGKAFANSTLLRKINAGDSTAADEFANWIYAHDANGNKIEVAGLRDDRRPSEKAQFLS